MLSNELDLENVNLSTIADEVSWAIVSIRDNSVVNDDEEIKMGIKLCEHLQESLAALDTNQEVSREDLYSTVNQLTSTRTASRKGPLRKMINDSDRVKEKLSIVLENPNKLSDSDLKDLQMYFAELTGHLISS